MVGRGTRGAKSGSGLNFTDRVEPLARLEEALQEPQANAPDDHSSYRVLAWNGPAGHGKTWLLDEFVRRLRKKRAAGEKIAWARINFEDRHDRDPIAWLLRVRMYLAECGVHCPTFDTAFFCHYQHRHPRGDFRRDYPELAGSSSNDVISALIDWAADVVDDSVQAGTKLNLPGSSLVYRYTHQLTGAFRRWWARQDVKEKVTEVFSCEEGELLARLPEFLGFDIHRVSEIENGPRLVLLFDAVEAIKGLDPTDTSDDGANWLRSLIDWSPGTLVVLTSRQELCWKQFDPDWEHILVQGELESFEANDADAYLRAAGVPTEKLRRHMSASAGGSPLFLGFLADHYRDLIERDGMLPAVNAFEDLEGRTLWRFLRHLPEETRKEIRVLSYPRVLTRGLLRELANRFLGGEGRVSWSELERRSFMASTEKGDLRMHQVFRQALQTDEKERRPDVFAAVHQCLHRLIEEQLQALGDSRTGLSQSRADCDEKASLSEDASFHYALSGEAGWVEWAINRAQHLVWLRWEQPQTALRILDALMSSGRVAGFDAGEVHFVRGSAFLCLRDQHRAWQEFHDQMVADDHIMQEKSAPRIWKSMVRRRQAEEAERFSQHHVAAAVSLSELRLLNQSDSNAARSLRDDAADRFVRSMKLTGMDPADFAEAFRSGTFFPG